MRNIAQLLLMCDGHDIGISVDGGAIERQVRTGGAGAAPAEIAAEPHIFIYDNYPGGIGFSRPLFEMHLPLLERSRELIDGCPCASGLPVLRRAGRQHRAHAKQVASLILQRLLWRRGGRPDGSHLAAAVGDSSERGRRARR